MIFHINVFKIDMSSVVMDKIYTEFVKLNAPEVWGFGCLFSNLHEYVLAGIGEPIDFGELLDNMPEDSLGHSINRFDLEQDVCSSRINGRILLVRNSWWAPNIKLAPHVQNIHRSYMEHWGSIPRDMKAAS